MLDVLHEDDELLVLNKPAGLVVHPSKDGEQSSLIGRVRVYLGHAEGRLVNRLDRETSGVVMIAKSAVVARELNALLAARRVDKTYDAIVHGAGSGALTIDAPIGTDEASEVAIKDRVRPDGAPARTDLRFLRTFVQDGRPFSLAEVVPRTGRKHQIRIHLAHAGFPMVGDKLYGADETIYLRFIVGAMTPEDEAGLILRHQALHARAMGFRWRERDWRFEAAPDPEFLRFSAGGRAE